MNLALQFLIQGSVGFAIGAGTNELAIRWVFWTLLSKKKEPIAEAVQTVVSSELMSPEKIISRLSSPEVAESLRLSILSAVDNAARRPLPSLDTLASQYEELEFDVLRDQLATLAADAVADRFDESAFCSEVLRPFIEDQWQHLKSSRPIDLLPPQTRDVLAELPEHLASFVLTDEHRERLCDVLDSGLRSWMIDYPTPASLLGPANIAEVAALASSRTHLLGEELAALLATPPAQSALCEAIRAAVHARLNNQGMLGSILNGLAETSIVETQLVKFCEGIPDIVRDQFSDEGDSQRMQGLVETAVHKLAERNWSELLDIDAPDAIRKQLRSLLDSDAVRDMTRHGFASVITSVLDSLQTDKLEEAATLVAKEDDIPGYLDWMAKTVQGALCSSKLRPQLKQQIQQMVCRICSRPIGPPDHFLPDNSKPRLAALITEQITTYLRYNVSELVEITRIWDVISESIIVYDNKKMEEIVRSVANRELRWVTLLGGLIGLLAGIAQGILLLILR